MAKFKQNNVELRDNQKLIFDSAKNKYMSYDGAALFVNSTISGVDPTSDEHLTTKTYVDVAITTATGSLTSDHGDLTGLGDDDHPHYAKQAVFATHSGNGDIHYEQSAISITESQVSDLGDYATNAQLTTTSGDIVSQIPTDFYTQAEVDTISGSLDAAKEDAFSKNTAFNKDFGITDTTVASGSHTHAPPVFGTEHAYNSSEGESSTTNSAPQEKVTLALTSLPEGTYRIDYSLEGSSDDDKNSIFAARVQIDDTTTIFETPGAASLKGWEDSWMPYAGFYETTLSGTADIDLDYWDSGIAAVGVNIRRARLSSFRIS